ncbi:hypothetical protein Tco_0900993 [Tanacetum coccineum]
MSTLQFADTHNLVVFLAKPAESEGFKQIVDFLNAHTIKYALTVNPTIYTSCIEQFWATVKVKTVNGEQQLQALVDGKKIVVTEASVRRDLQLDDEEGTDCLPNATIFEELTRMGYEKLSQKLTFYKAFFSPQWKFLIHTILQCLSAKTTAWNEFSSTMASAIICLATNQKFNFSKYIFESMVKNLENVSDKFLMYPRFVQVFLDKQLEGMSSHKRIYVTPSHTKKIFGNMKKVGKGFSRRDTPLFPTMMVQAQQEQGEGSAMPTDPQHTPTIIQPSTSQPQMKQRSRRPKRKDTEIPQSSVLSDNVADEAVNEEMDDSLVRAATTATGLDVEQDRGNINKTQSKATPNEPSSLGTSSGVVNTPRSNKDRLKLNELMEFCTKLQQRVLDLENTKTAQAQEITSLKLRVKKLEKKAGSRTHKLKILYKVGRSARVISCDEASLGDQGDASKQGRKIDDIDKDRNIKLLIQDVNLSVDKVTLAQALAALKSAKVQEKVNVVEEPSESITTTPTLITTTATTITAVNTRPKAKGLVIHEEEQATTPTVSSQQPSQVKAQDKGKGIMVEEPVKKKKKDQISLDEELDFKLQAKEEEEERLVKEKSQREEEANIVEWDNVIKEKSKLFVQLLEARKKHFAAIREKEKRNKPPTKAQKINTMSTYLKNMAGYKHNQLKNKSFDVIQKLFDKAIKRVNTFVDMDTELVKGSEVRAEAEIAQKSSSKRAGEALEQESSKKQKLEEDKESEELKQCLEIIPDDGDDVTIDATPLSTKSPSIVNYKIYKEGKKRFFQIIRADGNSQMYLTFVKMLKNFNREDLEVLWSVVKARFKKTEPVNYMDNFLLLNLKTMFEHHVEDNNILYYLLVEKMYPLTNHTLHQMFNDVKLQVDYECKMAFELLILVKKQLKEGYVPE